MRPGLATTGGPLIAITSPHAKKGETWETYKRDYGPAGDPAILVARGASRDLNPSLSQRTVDRALARNRSKAEAEYLAIFRGDIESFISREQVEACVEVGKRERAPQPGLRYFSFTDPSGGSADAMTCAVDHKERDAIVVDALRVIEPPFNPQSAVEELARFLKSYRVTETQGDRYAANWVTSTFAQHHIRFKHTELNKSQLYLELLPRLNAQTIRLLDLPTTISQISQLERRAARGGRDTIDHPPNGRDDEANAIAGLAGILATKSTYDSSQRWATGNDDGGLSWRQWERNMFVLSGGRFRSPW